MKRSLLVLASALLSASIQAGEPRVVVAPVDHLFVPQGFDNNDNIEVVVTGKFPNPCFIRNKVDVQVDKNKILVNITALQKEDKRNEICSPMPVPFSESVTIGSLQGGEYEIVVNKGSKFEQLKKMNVAVSSSNSVDDYIYASVDYVDLGFTGGADGSAFIIAKSPSDCMVFDHVEYVTNDQDTLSVLPIMKRVSQTCIERSQTLQIPIKFDLARFNHSKLLLFVRSMDGKAVNTLVNR